MTDLKTLQAQLESLKHLMEQYFMGTEKRLPFKARQKITRAIRTFTPGTSSIERFKYQNLMQRLMTLERYWNRTIKAIEEGRYHRDVFKADYRVSQKKVVTRPQNDTPPASTGDAREAQAFLDALTGVDGQHGTASSILNKPLPKIALRGQRRHRTPDPESD